MLGQLNMYGKDKVQVAIERFRAFEPPDGYYLAFSGGKDSVVIKALADMASVKYDAHYNITSVDPPELVRFVKLFKDVKRECQYWEKDGDFHKAGDPITMWNLIPEKRMPPTRIVRYCCRYLKESSGANRFVVTGVRKAESAKRSGRAGLEIENGKTGKRNCVDPDNPDQGLIHMCQTKASRFLNPIIDWEDTDVWEFIKTYKIDYCKLYDQGHKRLGCVGCPMAGTKRRERDFNRYPKIKQAYIRAFDRMIQGRINRGLDCNWKTGQEVMDWWIKER